MSGGGTCAVFLGKRRTVVQTFQLASLSSFRPRVQTATAASIRGRGGIHCLAFGVDASETLHLSVSLFLVSYPGNHFCLQCIFIQPIYKGKNKIK